MREDLRQVVERSCVARREAAGDREGVGDVLLAEGEEGRRAVGERAARQAEDRGELVEDLLARCAAALDAVAQVGRARDRGVARLVLDVVGRDRAGRIDRGGFCRASRGAAPGSHTRLALFG